MPGVTKHIYDRDIYEIILMWNKQLKNIENILPAEYTESDIVGLLKHFYPHEWESVKIKYWYYNEKDDYLKRYFGKTRYNMCPPEKLLTCSTVYRSLLSLKRRKEYADNYSEEVAKELEQKLWNKRRPKIERVDQKIERAKSKTQLMTPDFIDQLMGLYERKNTSQKDKMYILLEMKKYYSFKIMKFFFKLNDTELNRQLRETAFYHLQSFNYNPRMRRQKYMQVHTKNKKRREYLKKVYPYETYNIPLTPEELDYRIENAKEQKIKSFDYFISHSYIDRNAVQDLIYYENKNRKNVFCDWISDSDYLKRNLLCDATLRVIEKRLEQSESLLFVDSVNSRKSIWCKYELNYFHNLGKPMYVIKKCNIEKNEFVVDPFADEWYLDPDYKRFAVGSKV